MKLGIERFLANKELIKSLSGQRVALLAHPASTNKELAHSLDLLAAESQIPLVAGFGPQHGLRGEKQDNMVESDDYIDPDHGMPIFSLYGEARRPSQKMIDHFDVLMIDLQDVGCRIYTFLTTLGYMLEACAENKKKVIVLDRPNPAGRPIEGMTLIPGEESFVGLGALPMRHGLTLGEAALWWKDKKQLAVELEVVKMEGYQPNQSPQYGWPLQDIPWVNPSPNIANAWAPLCFPGTVMIEATTLSEGRGTTRPLEVIGAPDLKVKPLLKEMKKIFPAVFSGCLVRPCFFEPTFHKHEGKICEGFQIHVDGPFYDHAQFKPYRLVSVFLKALKNLETDYPIWRDFIYEYEPDRKAIDVINGSDRLRNWIEDSEATYYDLDSILKKEESEWASERQAFLLY